MLIGDIGGPEDSTTNYALAGYTGEELQRIAGSNLSVKDSYKTLLVKERGNATDIDSYRSKTEEYWPILIDEIRTINPHLIIPMNEVVFNRLTGLNSIRKFRGSVLMSRGLEKPTKILPILGMNPFINQEYKLRWLSQIDFTKVPKNSYDDSLPEEQTKNIWIAKNATSLRNFLDRSYNDNGILVFDIETFFGIPICIGLCFDGNEAVCVPFLDTTINQDDRVLMLYMLAKLLASKIRKINQNIKFDWKRLERFHFEVNNVTGDTIIGASLLTPELPKNLGFLTSIYTEIPYFKDEGKASHFEYGKRDRTTYYLYNAKDCLATYQINQKQEKEIDEIGSRTLYNGLIQLLPVYKKMEEHGIRIDEEARFSLHSKYSTFYNIQLLKLQRILNNSTFNPKSPKQCATAIFEEMGYNKPRQVTGTDEESLEWLMVSSEAKRSPIFGRVALMLIIDCRKLHKVIEYLETGVYADGTWKCEYNLAGTVTGRTSAGGSDEKLTGGQGHDQIFAWEYNKKGLPKLVINELGRSFQTIAKHGFMIDGEIYGKELRKIFVPRTGYSFVEIDLSQAEARVDAVLAGNFEILKVFDGPIGIHKLTGSWVFDCDPLEIKKNTLVVDPMTGISVDRYLMSKVTRHAAERNMQAERLVMMTQKPLMFCRRVLGSIHAKQPEIQEVFHHDVRQAVDLSRTLVSPHGRSRQFLDRKGDKNMYNNAISQLPQCIVSDQLKLSLIPTMQATGDWANLINEAHDGCLAEIPFDREMEFAEIYKKNIETPIDFNKCTLKRDFQLVIPSEVSMSRENWYSLEEVKQ